MSAADLNTRELPFDGHEIAKLYVETAKAHGGLAAFTNEGVLAAWFGNAAMRGYDERARMPRQRWAAVVAFAAWLTCRKKPITIGANYDAAPVAELVTLFCESQQYAPPLDGWDNHLLPYPTEEQDTIVGNTNVASVGANSEYATFEQLVEDEDSLFDHEPILKFFRFSHLPPHLQAVSRPFSDMAARAVQQCKASAERTEGLRKLLEAKDCIVRAYL